MLRSVNRTPHERASVAVAGDGVRRRGGYAVATGALFKQAPEFRPLRHDAYAALYEAILLGTLPPGERLVEAEIARQMGISRGPLREAIRQLEQDGLVEYRPRKGAVVAALTRERVLDAYTTRVELEGFAARLAVARMTTVDLERLEALCEAMQRYAGDGDSAGLLQTDVKFHQTICEISGNRVLLRLWTSLGPHGWTLFSGAQQRGYGLPALAERHCTVLAALRSGDAALAERAAREHTQEIMRNVLDQLYPGTPTPGEGAESAGAPARRQA
jgi:DNA-binding GntR family transcriptional regulator